MGIDKEFLNKLGWIVKYENPLEIIHNDGSSASGRAAEMVLASLKNKIPDDQKISIPIFNSEWMEAAAYSPKTQILEVLGEDGSFFVIPNVSSYTWRFFRKECECGEHTDMFYDDYIKEY